MLHGLNWIFGFFFERNELFPTTSPDESGYRTTFYFRFNMVIDSLLITQIQLVNLGCTFGNLIKIKNVFKLAEVLSKGLSLKTFTVQDHSTNTNTMYLPERVPPGRQQDGRGSGSLFFIRHTLAGLAVLSHLNNSVPDYGHARYLCQNIFNTYCHLILRHCKCSW